MTIAKDWQKKTLFIAVFALIGFGLMQVPFTKIIGSNLKFSLFDFYGPIAGGFIGSLWGMATVLIMQIANWALHGFAVDTATLIRFFPMLFATLYFARKSKWILAVPLAAMLAFWLHPEGRGAWYFALYWLIPVAAHFWREKFLFARALGATFTAHSVGSTLFLYALNLKTTVWLGLIPVVWKERGLMAIGITLTFIVFSFLLGLASRKIPWLGTLRLNPKYLWGHK